MQLTHLIRQFIIVLNLNHFQMKINKLDNLIILIYFILKLNVLKFGKSHLIKKHKQLII